MIEVKNLYKSYGPVDVLNGINLNIDQKGIVAILGPNGSGKTTLIKTLLGMVISQKGDLLLNKEPVKNKWQYRDKISYMPQIANFPQNLKVSELVSMIKNLRGQTAKDKSI